VVVVDESYGNYHDPAFSVASEICNCPNLAVLRGLAKGYWMGSLRLGYCLSTREVADTLRSHIAPMGVSSLSIRLARAILNQGSIAGPLRVRVKSAQEQMVEALISSGFPETIHHAEGVPFVFCKAVQDTAFNWLSERGILAKRQPFWDSDLCRVSYKIRMSVPLREERMQHFLRCLGKVN
jgi:histidinol-phosphate/aromatic aminotransferase/cobyric acid decarboxylase-like protein